jgi:predicted DNA-binding transcriptional regulator AlpA
MSLDLCGAAEIAELLGVSRQQVHRLAKRTDFPRPVAKLQSGHVWEVEAVRTWAKANEGRRPGRPETPRPPT